MGLKGREIVRANGGFRFDITTAANSPIRDV